MKTEIMVDIESLSSEPDGAIIAIGLVQFNQEEILDEYEILIDPQLAIGHRSTSTLEWWNRQDPKVYEKMMSGELTPWDACEEMVEIIAEWGSKIMWANAPTFDISMLRLLFKICDVRFPIKFNKEMDFRTLKNLTSIDYSAAYGKRKAHDAVDDAKAQARAVQIIRKELLCL